MNLLEHLLGTRTCCQQAVDQSWTRHHEKNGHQCEMAVKDEAAAEEFAQWLRSAENPLQRDVGTIRICRCLVAPDIPVQWSVLWEFYETGTAPKRYEQLPVVRGLLFERVRALNALGDSLYRSPGTKAAAQKLWREVERLYVHICRMLP